MDSGNEGGGESPRRPPSADGSQSIQAAAAGRAAAAAVSAGTARTDATAAGHGFVAASPPRHVTLDELMKASHMVQNMVLSHEIAVNDQFSFQQAAPPENSLEKQVSEIMKKAFWDSLKDRLSRDPPDYSHALVLIAEIKEKLLQCLLPHHTRMRARIDEVLDMELIAQKIEHGAFDLQYYVVFIVTVMSSLCAPARDDDVAHIKDIGDPVLLFREVFRVLDLMLLDLAHFTISQLKPYIQQQSVEYERQTFANVLKTQEDASVDGLEFTRSWLIRSHQHLSAAGEEATATSASSPASAAASGGGSSSSVPDRLPPYRPSVPLTAAAVLNCAYVELLQWSGEHEYPETCLLDAARFSDCGRQLWQLSLVGAVLTSAGAALGQQLASACLAGGKVKDELLVIASSADVHSTTATSPAMSGARALHERTLSLAEHLVSAANRWLASSGQAPLDADWCASARDVIAQTAGPGRPVLELLRKRLLDFILQSLSSAHSSPLRAPPGTTAIAAELTAVCGKFLRLVSHNKAVFGKWYADLVSAIMNVDHDISPR